MKNQKLISTGTSTAIEFGDSKVIITDPQGLVEFKVQIEDNILKIQVIHTDENKDKGQMEASNTNQV